MIETERLLLREYTLTDWNAVHEYAQQEEILIYEAWGPNTKADTQHFIETVLQDKDIQPRTVFEFAITLKTEQKLIGGCKLWLTDTLLNTASIGYIINPLYWRNGYATEATKALINYATEVFNITTIHATCDELNLASQSVLEKCGFTLKEKIINHFEMKGRFRNTLVYEQRPADSLS